MRRCVLPLPCRRISSPAVFGCLEFIRLGQHQEIGNRCPVQQRHHLAVAVHHPAARIDQEQHHGATAPCGANRRRSSPASYWLRLSSVWRSHSRAGRPASTGPQGEEIDLPRGAGVWDVRARLLRPVRALTRLDLPALERPTNATSFQSLRRQILRRCRAPDEIAGPANSLRAVSISPGSVIRRFGLLALRLPRKVTSTPSRFMMNHCWATDRRLFQA